MQSEPTRLAVLLSGGGRTLLNIHDRILDGALNAAIEVVISSRGDVAGVERSRARGLRTVVVERRAHDEAGFQVALTEAVGEVDLVCMAGFLSLWRIPQAMEGRVINIHPALLPDFGGKGMYGARVHEAVIAVGAVESGCTVHFCDNVYDHGPTILQRKVRVLPADSPDDLAARVFQQECIAYPEAIGLFCEGRIVLDDRQVKISKRST